MGKYKHIEIGGIGQILFERSNRAKRINITVKPFTGVRVAVPYRVSFDKAREFAQSKKNWIKNHTKAFWAELNKFVGDAKKMSKKMNEYGVFLM